MSLNLKVEWKGNDITSTVSSITWSGSAYSSARSLEFSVVNPAGDTHFKTPDIKLGDLICFYNGNDKLFHGKLTKRERKGEAGTITYTAQDYMLYLIRSKGTYKFKKKKPEQITQLICKDLKIKTKSIANTCESFSIQNFPHNPESTSLILIPYPALHLISPIAVNDALVSRPNNVFSASFFPLPLSTVAES